VLTSADIPPGGEGSIEVTFDSGHKKGSQQKTVTIESNDPRTPKATLNISVLIRVDFGFEEYSIDMGKLQKGQSVTKTATLIVEDSTVIKTMTLVSSSPYFSVKLVDNPAAEKGHLTVEVTGQSEIPAGRIDATITARANNLIASQATLPIRGRVIGNFEASPEVIQFHVDTAKGETKAAMQVIKFVSTADDAKYHIVGFQDTLNRLSFHVDTLVADKQYDVAMTPLPDVLGARKNVSGTVIITTDDIEQPTVKVSYAIFFGR
jgi:hypothetical protein